MLTEIRIKDFQKHEKLRVQFDPQITTIVGATDAGKSTILRAIKWVALNQSLGDGDIRIGAEFAAAKLFIDDHTIERRRGKGGNLYFLDDSEFKAFGVNVPQAIADLVNVGPINFQGQLDPLFWFHLPAGQVAKQLNSVVDLGIIDKAMEHVSEVRRRAMEREKDATSNYNGAVEAKERLTWITEADAEFRKIEDLETELEAVESRVLRLSGILDQIETLEQASRESETRFESAKRAMDASYDFEMARRECDGLKKLLDSIEENQQVIDAGYPDTTELERLYREELDLTGRVRELKLLISEIEELETVIEARFPDVSKLETAMAEWQEAHLRLNRLIILLDDIETTERKSIRKRDEWTILESKVGLMACPVCGGFKGE